MAGELLHEAAAADGVHMHYGEEVDEFVRSNGAITKVRTNEGRRSRRSATPTASG